MAVTGTEEGRAADRLTIDQLAAACHTTTRRVRSFQTLGLLPRPELRGRTGLYGQAHRDRLTAILRLQARGFSLESLGVLFDALAAGRSLAEVLGVVGADTAGTRTLERDEAELYGFADLQRRATASPTPPRRALLAVVPTTVWDETQAS